MSPRRRRERRDRIRIASALPLVSLPLLSRVPSLLSYEDRRTFVPSRFSRPAFSLPRSASRLVVPRQMRRTELLRNTVAFAFPGRVAVCVRRVRRREVLFALGVGGGRGRKGRPRRNEWSNVSCRR